MEYNDVNDKTEAAGVPSERMEFMATAKKAKTSVPAKLDDAGKKQALATAMSQIERDFGAGSIMRLGENRQMEVQAIHTGSLSLDLALGQ